MGLGGSCWAPAVGCGVSPDRTNGYFLISLAAFFFKSLGFSFCFGKVDIPFFWPVFPEVVVCVKFVMV